MTDVTAIEKKTLKVPGATLYYEVRGQGRLLVLISGGPTDADANSLLASCMAKDYRVVTYDPRGNSRSVLDGAAVDQDMDTHGDDVAALVHLLGSGNSALIFGNSGGAQIGMNFTARYPELVKRLVAHEPPCISLLPDAAEVIAQMRNVKTFNDFLEIAGMAPRQIIRTTKNIEYFLEYCMRAIGEYRPEIAKLKNSDIVVGAGVESKGQLAYRTAAALAEKLGTELVLFPKDHSTWARDPDEFAKTLASALTNAR